MKRVRKITNLNHPSGQRIIMYEQDIKRLDEMSDNVSLTSLRDQQYNKYDSDVYVDIKKIRNNDPYLNLRGIQNMSESIGS